MDTQTREAVSTLADALTRLAIVAAFAALCIAVAVSTVLAMRATGTWRDGYEQGRHDGVCAYTAGTVDC